MKHTSLCVNNFLIVGRRRTFILTTLAGLKAVNMRPLPLP